MRHQLYSPTIPALAIFLLLTGLSAQSSATSADYSNPLDNKNEAAFSHTSKYDPLKKPSADSIISPTAPQHHRPQILSDAIEHEGMIKSLQGNSPSNEADLNRIRPDPWHQ